MKSVRKPIRQRPRAVPQRSRIRSATKVAPKRNRYAPKRTLPILQILLQRLLIAACIVFLILGSGYLFIKFWLIPELLFSQDSVNKTIAFIPPGQEIDQILVVRLSETAEETHVWHVTEVPPMRATDLRKLRLNIASELGIIPDYVQVVQMANTALGFVENLSVVPQNQPPWKQLADMRTVSGLQLERLTYLMRENTVEEIVATEFAKMKLLPVIHPQAARECPIVLSNTTEIPGLAEQMSRVFERAGILVVRTISSQELLQETRVVISTTTSPECQEIAQKLADAFAVDSQLVVDANQKPQLEQYRAAILVELGQDFVRDAERE